MAFTDLFKPDQAFTAGLESLRRKTPQLISHNHLIKRLDKKNLAYLTQLLTQEQFYLDAPGLTRTSSNGLTTDDFIRKQDELIAKNIALGNYYGALTFVNALIHIGMRYGHGKSLQVGKLHEESLAKLAEERDLKEFNLPGLLSLGNFNRAARAQRDLFIHANPPGRFRQVRSFLRETVGSHYQDLLTEMNLGLENAKYFYNLPPKRQIEK